MKKVAVTGGLSSGKSTVCQILKKNGAYVVSADEIVHQLLNSNTLNQEIITQLGTVDRSELAKIVFSDPKKLEKLEAILHPIVMREIEKSYEEVKRHKGTFVAEVPLLYEIKAEKFFAIVIAVVRSAKPVMPDAEKRMKRQLPQEEKAARADYVIVNDGTLEELEQKTLDILKEINGPGRK